MKDITLLIAHPDDEALFCWPVLDRVKRIVCASSDLNAPGRPKGRGDCLHKVGDLLGCEIAIFDNASEFYRLQTRPNDALKQVALAIMEQLEDAEIIYTHNAWGEYGHLDHILCHHIGRTIQAQGGCELLCSDIAKEINWLPIVPWSMWCDFGDSLANPAKTSDGPMLSIDDPATIFEIDRPLFERIKAIYDKKGCWTWNWEPQESCRVYSV